jgi:hypothetical protein
MDMNTFDSILCQVLEKKGLEVPAALGDLWTLMSELNHAHFGDPVREAFKGPRERFLPHEALGFAMIYGKILTGDVACSILPLSDECGCDSDRARNDTILRRGTFVFSGARSATPLQFNAKFAGGWGDNDGHFTTLSRLAATRHVMGNGLCALQTVLLEPRRYPLEVGSSAVGTTVMHVLAESGLARWPYRTPSLYIFHLLRENEQPEVIATQPCDTLSAA